MSKPPAGFIARGGAWVIVQSILMSLAVALGVVFQGPWTQLPVIIAGGILFLVGGCVGVCGVIALGRHRTAFPSPAEGSALVQHGIYASIRHPLYTSVVLALVGWSLFWQSLPSLLVALALAPFFRAKAKAEERWLLQRFPGYPDYMKRVPGFVPRWRPPPHVCL